MTLVTTTNRKTYTAGVSQTVYPYDFKIFAETDLRVYLDGVEQLLTTHYAVSGVGADGGGNVTLVSAPPTGASVVIVRDLPFDQRVDLVDHDALPAETMEGQGLDRIVMLVQQLNDALARVPQLTTFSPYRDLTLDDPTASALLRWKADLTGIEAVQLASISPSSVTVPISVANGGTGSSTAAAARQALGLDGQVRKTLQNRSGGTVLAGHVLVPDASNDSAVTLGDTASSKHRLLVAVSTAIADGAAGEFVLAGVCAVAVTGAVTRGHYLRKSTTTLVAEDAGVAASAAADPPQGAFALALTGDAGGVCTALCFGFTYPGSPVTPVISGRSSVTNLRGTPNAGAPTTDYDLAADLVQLRDPSTGTIQVITTGLSVTVSAATAGPAANGRDQAAAFGANTWLHLYYIGKADGTAAGLLSTTAPPTGPTLPSGYTTWAYAGALRFDNSSQLVRTRLRGARAFYEAAQVALASGTSTTEAAITVTGLVPPNALAFTIRSSLQLTALGTRNAKYRVVSGTDAVQQDARGGADGAMSTMTIPLPNISQTLLYLVSGSNTNVAVHVVGYETPA